MLREIVAATKTPEERALQIAVQVYEAREKFVWVAAPPRPVNLPDDAEVLELVESLVRGEPLGKEKARLGSLFGSWRAMVRLREVKNVHNAAMLCVAWRTLDALGRTEEADAVIATLATFGGIDWGTAPQDYQDLLRWAHERLIFSQVLTTRLRLAGSR